MDYIIWFAKIHFTTAYDFLVRESKTFL
jgi:hypothetical protein